MGKTKFLVQLLNTDDMVIRYYDGYNASLALHCYQDYFRELLTVRNMKTIVTAIDGKTITQHFELIVQDMYL